MPSYAYSWNVSSRRTCTLFHVCTAGFADGRGVERTKAYHTQPSWAYPLPYQSSMLSDLCSARHCAGSDASTSFNRKHNKNSRICSYGVVNLASCSETLPCHANCPAKPIESSTEVGQNLRHPTIAMFIR